MSNEEIGADIKSFYNINSPDFNPDLYLNKV